MTRYAKIQWDQVKWMIIGLIAMVVIITFMVLWGDLMKGGGTDAIKTIMNYLRTNPQD